MSVRNFTCSWCGKKISFLRTLSNAKYCSPGHREQEQDSMRKLAIERLQDYCAPAVTELGEPQLDRIFRV